MPADPRFMRRAIELARIGMNSGAGGPFGAVVVKDGEIIGEGLGLPLVRFPPRDEGIASTRTKVYALGGDDLVSGL